MQTFLVRDDHEQLLTNTGNGVFGENEENGADDGFEAPRRQQLHELGTTVHEDLHKRIPQQATSRVLYLVDFANETILKK